MRFGQVLSYTHRTEFTRKVIKRPIAIKDQVYIILKIIVLMPFTIAIANAQLHYSAQIF